MQEPQHAGSAICGCKGVWSNATEGTLITPVTEAGVGGQMWLQITQPSCPDILFSLEPAARLVQNKSNENLYTYDWPK